MLPQFTYEVLDLIRRAVAEERSSFVTAAEIYISDDRREELRSVLETVIARPERVAGPDGGREPEAERFGPAVEECLDRVRLLSRVWRFVDAFCRAIERSVSVAPSTA